MKVVFINKSDTRGGAAVVTLRLVQALRARGVDARMLVAEKNTGHDYVAPAAPDWRLKWSFLADRLPLLLCNGFRRSTLFQVDAALSGLPLHRHPWVQEADAVVLGWVNQGLLSLRGIRRIGRLGKPLLWVMHDMWCMTGVCHHAHRCRSCLDCCGNCPLLGGGAGTCDLSTTLWKRKRRLYNDIDIQFVAVSRWLADRARESSLLGSERVAVVPNAFPEVRDLPARPERPTHIIMVAARLDDPIKGLPLLAEATKAMRRLDSERAGTLHLDLVGEVRDLSRLDDLALPYTLHGTVADKSRLKELYARAGAVVSPSLFETLPGTLVEGQALGALPVAFDRGGQRDIIDHLDTGYLADWDEDPRRAGENLARGLLWALDRAAEPGMAQRLHDSVNRKFAAPAVADAFIHLIQNQ